MEELWKRKTVSVTVVLHSCISLLLHFPRFTPHLIKIVNLQVNSETTKVSSTSLGGAQSAELL